MPEMEPLSESAALAVGEARQCTVCGTALTGPFEPELRLVRAGPGQDATVTACAWACPGCGLVHWYARQQDLEKLGSHAGAEQDQAPKPGSSYERRMQVLQALRRVRRL